MNSNCSLCDALKYPETEMYNRVLYDSDKFVIIPSIGPLTPGHVMIVSKSHHPNLGSMGVRGINGYERLLSEVRSAHPLYRSELLEAEHGASNTRQGGACVIHTHIHLIPGLGRYEVLLDSELDIAFQASNLTALAQYDGPYIWVRGESGRPKVYAAPDVPSQLIRRRIRESEGRDDWDWAVTPKLSDIKRTINLWEAL